MTARRNARRRRGRNAPRINPYGPRLTPPPTPARDLEVEHFLDAVDPRALRTIGHWRDAIARPAYVYFIQQADAPEAPVKIGYATNPITRLGELQVGNPDDIAIRALVLATKRTEKIFHRHWGQARIRGEWFGHGYSRAIVVHAEEASARQIAIATGEARDPVAGNLTPAELVAYLTTIVIEDVLGVRE